MRQSSAGWKPEELYRLYEDFGFEIRHGSNHDVVKHPKYLQLRATVPRHSPIRKVYVKQAIALIEQLEKLIEAEESDKKEDK